MAEGNPPPHPDRIASTLALRDRLARAAGPGPFALPGPGSADARVDLKLRWHATRVALRQRGTDAARARLSGLDTPDLLAGTVQDGVARGLMVALEEAESLCGEPAGDEPDPADEDAPPITDRAQLRRARDVLIASAEARVRFSRKGGILLVDRARDVHLENCIRFEDRPDAGDLDGFVPVVGERPRLFSPGFLAPVLLEQGRTRDRLVLEGRLGRGPRGFPCVLRLEARKEEPFVRLSVRVRNDFDDHRLRIRFLGLCDPASIGHCGTPGWETVEHRGRRFVAATLVRACGRLRVGDRMVGVPGAQCRGWIEHEFRLGGGAATTFSRKAADRGENGE